MPIAMKIIIPYAGKAYVVDANDNKISPSSTAIFPQKLKGKKIKYSENITVHETNPCKWVYCGGRWYWRCW